MKMAHLLDQPFVTKDVTEELPDGREARGKGWGKGCGASSSPPAMLSPTPRTFIVQQPGRWESHTCEILMEALLYKDMMDYAIG